ncbi:hypothetical protein HBA_0940 [Sodalis endosymbiont of Henestaris halophilus]|nr:hypothetical protein HBA_0940 [Sodalis endosymbiont of Henestaris halophilus]
MRKILLTLCINFDHAALKYKTCVNVAGTRILVYRVAVIRGIRYNYSSTNLRIDGKFRKESIIKTLLSAGLQWLMCFKKRRKLVNLLIEINCHNNFY